MPTATPKLTRRQKDVVRVVANYRLCHGYAPTLQEIADKLEVSRVTVWEHVKELKLKGALAGDANLSRSLRVMVALPPRAGLKFPVLGSISREGVRA